MIETAKLFACLNDIGLSTWRNALEPLLVKRLSPDAHGDFERWKHIVDSLEDATNKPEKLRELLLALSPWRKGPFDVNGIHIESEWRSDLKWQRVKDEIAPLDGRNVLDVGCGNGYYALQMRKAGARRVIGVDPTLLYVMQFLAVNTFENDDGVFILPTRLHELPLPSKQFDTTFSMGVLYHQRAPIDHLRQLRQTLRRDGELVLETLFVPGKESYACTPENRYARMRNVWLLPTIAELTTWLMRCGYQDINLIDQTVTTVDEQRSTDWMTFESLAEALHPDDPSQTIEGWPAPRRVVLSARSP